MRDRESERNKGNRVKKRKKKGRSGRERENYIQTK